MADYEEIAKRMYPDNKPQQSTSSTPPPGEADEAIDRLYGSKPEPKQGNPYKADLNSIAESDKEQEKIYRFYGETDKVTLREDTDLSIIYQSESEQAALRENMGFMAAAIGAEQSDLHAIVSHANEALLTGEKFDPRDTMKALYDQHGKDLNQLLNDAQQLIRSLDPDLSTWLDQTGLGNSPVMINHFIRFAQSNRGQARLKKLKGL